MSGGQSRQVTALQNALAAEHAVIWGYGVVGAHLNGAALEQARSADATHRARRDALTARLRDAKVTPVAAAPSYELPVRVTDAASAVALAAHLEEGDAASWDGVLGATRDKDLRRTALAALTDAAVRGARWRQLAAPGLTPTVPFPGR